MMKKAAESSQTSAVKLASAGRNEAADRGRISVISIGAEQGARAVSYTHLDVYKRQVL